MKNSILLFTILILTISNIQSQNLIPIGEHFLYGDQYVTKGQVKSIMQEKPNAYRIYNKSQNQFKSAKAFGIVSIVSLSSGLLITSISAPFAFFSDEAASSASFGLILMLGGCVSGTIGLVEKKSAKQNLEKSLILYNQGKNNDKQDYGLDLSINGNGAGITFTF